ALDPSSLHLACSDLEKAFRRQAENRVVTTQALKTGERRGTGLTQRQVSRPGIAFAGSLKALGEVHLITVAGEDIALDAFDRLAIAMRVDIRMKRLGQPKGALLLAGRRLE